MRIELIYMSCKSDQKTCEDKADLKVDIIT